MYKFMNKHKRKIFAITIAGFFAGVFVGFGGYLLSSNAANETVIVINGKKIPYKMFSSIYSRSLESLRKEGKELEPQIEAQKKQEALQNLIQDEVFWQQSKKLKLAISDSEVASQIQSYPAFQHNGTFDQQMYFQSLFGVLKMNPEQFEDSIRKQISQFKLRNLILSTVVISEPELKFEYALANKGSMANFENNKKDFSEKLRQEKAQMIFTEWYKLLNQSTKIDVRLQKIEQNLKRS